MDIAGFLAEHEHYRYIFIFLLAIPEGTILPLVCGFLVSIGFLNPFLTYALIVSGDGVMDSLLYSIGRLGTPMVVRFGLKMGVTSQRLEHVRQRFEANRSKVLITSKLIHGPGTLGLVMAGILRVAYPTFVVNCLSVSVCRMGVLLLLGFLFGHAYEQVGGYVHYYVAGIMLAALAVIVFSRVKKRR